MLVFLTVLPTILPAQSAQRDSLLALAAAASSDSARVQLIMSAGKLYLGPEPDSALYWFDRAEQLAVQAGYQRGVARCKINSAYALLDLGRNDRALQLCQEAIPICERLNMGKELVAAYNSIGNVYNYRGEATKAIEYYLLALKTIEWAEGLPPHFVIGVRSNLAMLYVGLREYEKGYQQARETFEASLKLNDEASAANAAQHLATALEGMNRREEAQAYYRRALELGRKTRQPKLCVSMLGYLGAFALSKSRYDEAQRYYDEALQTAAELGDTYSLMTARHNLGDLALYQGRYQLAREHTLAALGYARQTNVKQYEQDLYLLLSDLALAQRDYDQYANYRQQYQDLRDTMVNDAVVYATAELETRYQTEQQQQKITQLQREQEIQQLRVRQKNGFMLGFAGLSVLVALLGFISYRAARQRRRLAEQEVVIQQQKIRELENEKQLAAVDAMLRGQEEERGRLARDLHDGLGGLLSGIKQSVHALHDATLRPLTFREHAGDTPASAPAAASPPASSEIAASLQWVEERLDHSIHELRQVSRNLMPEALLRFGLKDAVHDYCDHLAHAQGLQIHFQAYGLDTRIEQHVEVILFRVIQELLNNIVKHAAATQAIVQLIRDEDRLHLTVEDNGRGFDLKNTASPGIGWLNIRSRVDYLGGRLDVQSAPGKGTSVSVELNIRDNPANPPISALTNRKL